MCYSHILVLTGPVFKLKLNLRLSFTTTSAIKSGQRVTYCSSGSVTQSPTRVTRKVALSATLLGHATHEGSHNVTQVELARGERHLIVHTASSPTVLATF